MADARGPTRRTDTAGGEPASGDVKEQAKAKAEETRRQAASKAKELKAQGEDLAKEAQQKAEAEIDRRTSQGADRLDSVVRALHSAADRLDEDGQQWLSDYTRKAASQVDRVTGYLRDEDAPTMLGDLEDMARANPGTFLGTSFAAGLAAGRFLRSSQPDGGGGAGGAYPGSSLQGTGRDRTEHRADSSREPITTGSLADASAEPGQVSGPRTGGPAMASRAAGSRTPIDRATDRDEGRS